MANEGGRGVGHYALNIYTHVVDASHRQAVEAVEERFFLELDPNGPKLAIVPNRPATANARSA
jgi:hypothetical protein